ncbi:MAG TPA: glycosyltransferase family 9 protein [Thermoleophilia bacterium]|nr:glycosyltransferase family 9 protein [Thermoleophilia bacterium]
MSIMYEQAMNSVADTRSGEPSAHAPGTDERPTADGSGAPPGEKTQTSRLLAVRLDGLGDVILTGPAIRALAACCDSLTLLTGPAGAEAAALLPGVDEILVYEAPWSEADAPPLDLGRLRFLEHELDLRDFDEAVVFTSFHESPLPTALLLRIAGVPRISAISTDYSGSLLDVRHRVDDGIPEPERAVSLAAAAGFSLPPEDDGRLSLLRPLPAVHGLAPAGEYVVVHPGCSAPARSWPTDRWTETVHALTAAGHVVAVTGTPEERKLTAAVAGEDGIDLGGRTTLAELAAVLRGAQVAIAPNTGPAHLAAAVGTPVVSLFAPVVPAARWAPYGVPTVLLGDQHAACAGSRARVCPVAGHPCLNSVTAFDVVKAVEKLRHAGKPETDR